MKKYFLVAVGGFVGANVRYWLGLWLSGLVTGAIFPYPTLFINLTGSLLIGFLLGLYERFVLPVEWRLLLATGFLGAYTTFGTFSYETITLLEKGEVITALLYINTSLLLGMSLVWLGFIGSQRVRRIR